MNAQLPIRAVPRIPDFAAHVAAEIKTDYSSAGGAQILADRIARTWALHGYRVKTWTEPVHGTSGIGGAHPLAHAVRSDMIGGLPREFAR